MRVEQAITGALGPGAGTTRAEIRPARWSGGVAIPAAWAEPAGSVDVGPVRAGAAPMNRWPAIPTSRWPALHCPGYLELPLTDASVRRFADSGTSSRSTTCAAMSSQQSTSFPPTTT